MTTSWIHPTALSRPDKVIVLQCEGEKRDSSTLYAFYRAKFLTHAVCVEKISRLDIQHYFYWSCDLDEVSERSIIVVCSGEKTTDEYAKQAFIQKYSISSILKPASCSSSSSSSGSSSTSVSYADLHSLIHTSDNILDDIVKYESPCTDLSSSSSSPCTSSSQQSNFIDLTCDTAPSSLPVNRKPKKKIVRENSNKYQSIAIRYIACHLQPLYQKSTETVLVKSIYNKFKAYCKRIKQGRCSISVFKDAVIQCMSNASLSYDGKKFHFQ